MKTYLSEIFSSIQGEGPYVGERQLFIRFAGCHRSCVFCDTEFEKRATFPLERNAGSGFFELIENPVSVPELLALIQALDPDRLNKRIALTGGSPLLQIEFLKELLPRLSAEGYLVYLETTGDLVSAIQEIVQWVDVVSMDIKLSSVTHEANTFAEHWDFLTICQEANVEVFAKLIVSAETDDNELLQAVDGLLQAGGKDLLVILQPMSASQKTAAVPSGKQLLQWQEHVARSLPNVRVIPQTHKMMEVL